MGHFESQIPEPPTMTTLLVGFDSAWTRTNSGALVGVLCLDDGTFEEFGPPLIADYPLSSRHHS